MATKTKQREWEHSVAGPGIILTFVRELTRRTAIYSGLYHEEWLATRMRGGVLYERIKK